MAEEQRRREAALQLAAHIQVRMRLKQRRLTWSAWWRWVSHGRALDHKIELDDLRREFAAHTKTIGLENVRADNRRRMYLMKLTWVRAIDEKRSKSSTRALRAHLSEPPRASESFQNAVLEPPMASRS